MELKLISYNCKGFNISKVPMYIHVYIHKKLLDECNIVFIQEIWLYSSQFCLFSPYFPEWKSHSVCGINEYEIQSAHPTAVLLYCIVSLSNLLNLYGYNLREFVLLQLYWNTVNIIFLMYNYMPCDVSTCIDSRYITCRTIYQFVYI